MKKFTLKEIEHFPFYKKGSIQKVFRLNNYIYKLIDISDYNVSPNIVVEDIKKFIQLCQEASINIPTHAEVPYLMKEKLIVNKYSFEGIPLYEALQSPKLSLEQLYLGVLENLYRGVINGLGISSFHGQYTVNGQKVVWVDFFIPGLKSAIYHYKKGIEVIDYYLTHFSKNSVFLSGFTHYYLLLPEEKERIKKTFIKYFLSTKKNFPLIEKIFKNKLFWWYLENYKRFESSPKRWLLIKDKKSYYYFNSIESLIQYSSSLDLIINVKQGKVFCDIEIKKRLNNYYSKK